MRYAGSMKKKQFQPSAASLDPRAKALKSLRYAKRAVGVLEAYVEREPLPDWALNKVNQAATALGAAVSYIRYKENREAPK